MNDKLKSAIESLSKKSADATKADDAMKYAQAALSLSHAFAALHNADALK